MLAAGLPPLAANASCSAALAPAGFASAWGYREELREARGLVLPLAPAAALGGGLGAALLLLTPERVFDAVVPVLVGGATALLVLQNRKTERGEATAHAKPTLRHALAELLVGVYGGYFGAGIGILMLALWDRMGMKSLHHANAAKAALATVINVVAAGVLVARGAVDAPLALGLGAGAVLGGYVGARVARKTSPRIVRWVVVGVGSLLTLALGARFALGS